MKKFNVFLIVLTLFLYAGCSEMETSSAKQDKLDFQFIKGDYNAVVSHFDNIDKTGKILSDKDAYLYISSILGQGGFNALNGITAFTENGTTDIYATAGAMMGKTSFTKEEIESRLLVFQKAVDICNNRGVLDNGSLVINDSNISTLCTFTGMISTSVNLGAVIAQLDPNLANIDLSKTGFQDALANVDLNSPEIDKILSDEYINNLTNVLNCAFTQNDTVNNILGDTAPMLDEYKQQLFDNKTNKVTQDKVKQLIMNIKNQEAGKPSSK